MKTPIGILADYVSERAVENCINMFRKEQTRINPGKIGGAGLSRINKEWKDSLDCGIRADEIERWKYNYRTTRSNFFTCFKSTSTSMRTKIKF